MQNGYETWQDLFLLKVQLPEVSDIIHLWYPRCPLTAKAKPRGRRHQRFHAQCGVLLQLPWIQKQSQTALMTWTVEENSPSKIHRHQSGRKHLLDCWRTVSEVRIIWRDEIPRQVFHKNSVVNAVLTDTELGKHQVSLQGFFFFWSSQAVGFTKCHICLLVGFSPVN